MADYSAMKSYLEKNNLRYSTCTPNSEKPIKAVIHHLHPEKPADISKSLQNLGYNVNVTQMIATRTAPSGQTHMEPLPLSLVTFRRNKIS
jgi:hypothetical protein